MFDNLLYLIKASVTVTVILGYSHNMVYRPNAQVYNYTSSPDENSCQNTHHKSRLQLTKSIETAGLKSIIC